MTFRERCRGGWAFVLACALTSGGSGSFALAQSAGAPSKPGSGPPEGTFRCVDSSDGKIDFRGHVGHGSRASTVKIFPWSEGAVAYVENIEQQLGGKSASSQPPATTLADLEAAVARARQIPSALASADTAVLIDGEFTCSGFTPGRYLLLAQVYGGRSEVGAAKAAVTYYRAEVDVSSIHRRATVVIAGFRRIASYPPES